MVSSANDLIRKIDFFESLDEKLVNNIARLCTELGYSSGDHIVRQGDSGLGLFFIIRGGIKVELEKSGVRTVVATMQPGDFFGELSLIDNKPRSANVICVEDTRCLVLTRDSFAKIMNKYPEIGFQIAKALAGRIRATNERLEEQAIGPAVQQQVVVTKVVTSGSSQSSVSTGVASETSREPNIKEKLRDLMTDTFGFMYGVKAMTRFSAALIGCPVTVDVATPGPHVLQTEIHDVKIVIFPASQDQMLRIAAFDDGAFSATIFQPHPDGSSVHSFESSLRRDQTLFLHVPRAAEPWLENS
ncbi:MAG: hypothetical protein DMG57_25020 [Acidobacteria bacterium]|nr:MAG: hypothetical protein DMG57_25020 [Acidobacteriota bacterium]